ncbi:MAG: hypothetical protein COA33_008120 [Fluviicola sp.]|nr:hypothetical protein [Fluviicola sp.]
MIKAFKILPFIISFIALSVTLESVSIEEEDAFSINAEETEIEVGEQEDHIASFGYTYEKTSASDGGKDYHSQLSQLAPKQLISFISEEENSSTLRTEKNAIHHSPLYILYCSLKLDI